MVERALEIAEGDALVHAQPFELVKDGRVRRVGRVVAMHLAGDDETDGRRLLLHGADLHRRGVGAHEQAVAQRLALLSHDDERVLGVARGMVGREVQRLEVVVVGLDLGAGSDGVAESSEDAHSLTPGAQDGMLRADLRARAGERDIDSRAGRDAMLARSGIGQQGFDAFLERVEALAERAAGLRRRRFQPRIADRLEAAVLASQPFQPEVLDGIGAVQRAGGALQIGGQ